MSLPTKVLDSYAVMAFFESEPGSDAVRQLLLGAVRGELRLLMAVVNLGEVYYSIARSASQEIAEKTIGDFTDLPLGVVDVDWEFARQAALLKAQHPIAFADCFAAALARMHDCPVVTGDPEFHRLEDALKVEWI